MTIVARMKPIHAVVVVLVLVATGVLTAAPASAHASWLGSDPEEGTVLTELPEVVVMTYSEDIAPQFVDTAIVPPGGEPVPAEASTDGTTVTIDVAAAATQAATAGEWQVVARVVSVDGHPVEHTTTFEVEEAPAAPTGDPTPAPGPSRADATEPAAEPTPAPASAAPAASQPEAAASPPTVSLESDPASGTAGGVPLWAVLLLGLGAVAAAAVVVVRLRRRPPPT